MKLKEKIDKDLVLNAVVIILAIFVVGLFGVTGYKISTKYNVYSDELVIDDVNTQYMALINRLAENNNDFMISPIGVDLSVTNYANTHDYEDTLKAAIIETFKRGYKSWEDSTDWLKSVTQNEGIKLIDTDNKSIETIQKEVESLYEGITLDEDFSDGCLSFVELPTGLDMEVTEDENYVYADGNFYVAGDAVKLSYKDGKHEIIYYTDTMPEDSEWKEVTDTVRLPRRVYSVTAQLSSNIVDNLDVGVDNILQICVFDMRGDSFAKDTETTYKFPDNYRFLIRNKETKLVIAGGALKDE